LGRRLTAEEARAARRTRLCLTDPGYGTVYPRARLPRSVGHRLRTYLDALTPLRLAHLAQHGRVVPHARLVGEAFGQLLERLDPAALPHHGGDATTVVITIPAAQLVRDLGVATLADGTPVSAGEARRLACAAGLLAAALGTDSHHHLAHQPAYHHTRLPTGDIRFHRRT
jgi:hypothetical protein